MLSTTAGSCPAGYDLGDDGHSCLDRNECLSNNGHGPCQDDCVNVEGFYTCDCGGLPGTRLAADKHSCEPEDRCLEDNGGCSHTCISLTGQSFCSCPSGLELGDDWRTCRDVDECRNPDACGAASECVNTAGSFICRPACPVGQVLRGAGGSSTCVPDCQPPRQLVSGRCVEPCRDGFERTVGGDCVKKCKAGYRPDKAKCVPDCRPGETVRGGKCVSVCLGDVCGHGSCVPTATGGGFSCICDAGFRLQNGTCRDHDECTETKDLCANGKCINTDGSYYCDCLEGYRNMEGVCVDVNECEEGVVCSQACTNTEGSFQCGCWEGYTLGPAGGGVAAATTCLDIDECSLRPAICEQGCENMAGTFRCTCRPGFQADPADSTKCVRAGCQPLDPPSGGRLTCSPGPLTAGSVCRLLCRRGYARHGPAARRCGDNGQWEEGAGWCQPLACPPLPPLEWGVSVPSSCQAGPQPIKQTCNLKCLSGYSLQGSRTVFCGKKGRWVYRQGPTACVIGEATVTSVPDGVHQVSPPTATNQATLAGPPAVATAASPPSPYIICPPDMLFNLSHTLPPKEKSAYLTVST